MVLKKRVCIWPGHCLRRQGRFIRSKKNVSAWVASVACSVIVQERNQGDGLVVCADELYEVGIVRPKRYIGGSVESRGRSEEVLKSLSGGRRCSARRPKQVYSRA